MTDIPFLLSNYVAGITILTLNRPESRNSLSQGLLDSLLTELRLLADDETARVVIIAGAGPAFCAGHDLKELRAAGYDHFYTEPLFAQCAAVMQAVVRLPKPVIAQVHGVATAA